jgi:hypothetical protein
MIWAEVLAEDAVTVPMIDVPEDCDYQDFVRDVLTPYAEFYPFVGVCFF